MKDHTKEEVEKAIHDGSIRWVMALVTHESLRFVEEQVDRKLDNVGNLTPEERREFCGDVLFRVAGQLCEYAREVRGW